MLYAEPPVLVCRGPDGRLEIIKSKAGVIQGDPLGSFLFALVLQPVLEEFSVAFPDIPMHAFCDDMTMHNDVNRLADALVWLRPKLEELGLEVVLSKCSLFYRDEAKLDLRPMGWNNSVWVGAAQDEAGEESFRRGLQHGLNEIPGVQVRLAGSMVLGTPVGDYGWEKEQAAATMEVKAKALPKLLTLESHHARMTILRMCVHPRTVHLLRTMPPESIEQCCALFDNRILETGRACFGGTFDWDDFSREFMQTPLRFGGMGLTPTLETRYPAYLGSWWGTWEPIMKVFGQAFNIRAPQNQLDLDDQLWAEQRPRFLTGIHQAYNSVTSHYERLTDIMDHQDSTFITKIKTKDKDGQPHVEERLRLPGTIKNLLPDDKHPKRGPFPAGIPALHEFERAIPRAQSLFAAIVRASQWTSTYKKAPTHKRAIMLSRAEPGAGAAFVPPPGKTFTISNAELDTYCHFVLRLPLPVLAGVHKCECGAQIDSTGDHLFSCNLFRYTRKPVHDDLCRMWIQFNQRYSGGIKHSGVRHDDLDKQQHWKTYSPNHRPDCTLLNYTNGHTICDVTTTHPNCETYLKPKTVNSSTLPLVAAKEAEKSKHKQYGDAVRNGPNKLLPLVFETYGACGPALHAHLEAIREEEVWLDKHGRQETPKMRQNRLRLYKTAPFTARSHVNYWRQRFAVTNACGIANFINRAAQQLVLKNTF